MTQPSPKQQADVSEQTAAAVRQCLGWQKRMGELAHECDDDDLAGMCRDHADQFGYTAQRFTDMLQDGTSADVILDQLHRARTTVLGKDKSYTRETVLAFAELMVRIGDVSEDCRNDEEYE